MKPQYQSNGHNNKLLQNINAHIKDHGIEKRKAAKRSLNLNELHDHDKHFNITKLTNMHKSQRGTSNITKIKKVFQACNDHGLHK